ncbi:hemerythrin domain-containing protein [Iamia sp. SCSIO 61187]|uniref:hemerythrin domain-containing protein n=1 Tax=Iamia sp. SCSIO 61187 TaxID=2722752 RepID=UPI001C62D9ED|nr:hemerythrin domain-containing protein [Iamia sp. SCSIO 61187]QYG91922.1 hemerythrin domain-containing protein [Iamia sp. SCSIO 61187]
MSTTPSPPADLRSYRAIHVALRQAAHAMAAAAPGLDDADPRRRRAFSRYWKGYAGEVLAHHTTEDDVVFPALVARAPQVATLLEQLDADHHHLDALMADIGAATSRVAGGADAAALGALLRQLADHMDQHLAAEDAEILPLLEQHFTHDEFAELEAKALEIIGLGAQAAFTIPFVAASVDDAMRAHLLGSAPLPVRAIFRLGRGRHARLAELALGATRPAVAA